MTIVCIYLIGALLALLTQIYYERRFQYGMNVIRFIGALSISFLSFFGFIIMLFLIVIDVVARHADDMLFSSYDVVKRLNKEKKEKKARKKQKWDK